MRPFSASPNCGHPLAIAVVVVVIGTVGNSFLANFWILDFRSFVFSFPFPFERPLLTICNSAKLQLVCAYVYAIKILAVPGGQKGNERAKARMALVGAIVIILIYVVWRPV